MKILRSSAKRRDGLFNKGGRSLMYRIKRKSPRTEPCGTPEDGKNYQEDLDLLKITLKEILTYSDF